LLHDINRLDQISRSFGGGFFCVFPQVFRKLSTNFQQIYFQQNNLTVFICLF